jgi:hypothetical protein
MKLINIALVFILANSLFGFAPDTFDDSTFEVDEDYTYVHSLHPYYYDVAVYGTKSRYSINFKNNQALVYEEGTNTATYRYIYKKHNDTSATLIIETTYGTTATVNLTFTSESTGYGSYSEHYVSNELWSSANINFSFSQRLDRNNPDNWYLFGNYWHQPSSNTYVPKDKFLNGEGYTKNGERKIINDTTIPPDHLRWYKFANQYYWQKANDIYIKIEDYTKGNFENVFKMSNEEVNNILNNDPTWYKFGKEYRSLSLNVTVMEDEIDSSPYGESIKTYFSNEPRSIFYGYVSKNSNLEVIADPSFTPVNNNLGFFLSDGWVYSPKHGWIFTNSQIYPYFWLNKTQSWYCYKAEKGSSMVYDYKLNNWIFDF